MSNRPFYVKGILIATSLFRFNCLAVILLLSGLTYSIGSNAQSTKKSKTILQSDTAKTINVTYITYYVRIANDAISPVVKQDTLAEVSEQLEPYRGWLDVVFESAKSGKLKVFADKECKQPLTSMQVTEILIKKITYYKPDTIAPYEPKEAEDTIKVNWNDINLIHFYERWTVTADGKLRKEILSYAPVFEVEDNNVEFPFLKNTLFWVKNE